MKVWLLQYVIAPYRIELFKRISETEGIDFTLILLSDKFKTRPHWEKYLEALDFKYKVVSGVSLKLPTNKEIPLNPFFVYNILKEKPDVIICGGYHLASLLAYLAKLIRGQKFVVWTEATPVTEANISFLKKWIRKVLIGNACCVVDAGTLSKQHAESFLPKGGKQKFFRSYNCIDRSLFFVPGAQDDPYIGRDMPSRKILFVGALSQIKGIPHLMEIFKKIQAEYEDVALVVFGEGPLRGLVQEYRDKYGLKIFLEGWIANEKLPNYYYNSDMFILTSNRDANPLVLFEALASGIPILCTKNAGNAVEFVKDGVNGYVIDPENIEKSAEQALDVLSWEERRVAKAKEFSAQVSADVSYANSAKAFVDALHYCHAK